MFVMVDVFRPGAIQRGLKTQQTFWRLDRANPARDYRVSIQNRRGVDEEHGKIKTRTTKQTLPESSVVGALYRIKRARKQNQNDRETIIVTTWTRIKRMHRFFLIHGPRGITTA